MRPRALLLVALATSCEPRVVVEPPPGQILLYVDTDAPLPTGREPGPFDPAPLFDRLRIDVFAPGASEPCDACTNELAVDEAILLRRAASVGIAPPPFATGYRARLRLFYRALRGSDGTPDPDATIERVVALPAVPERGKVEITVLLSTDDVGVPVGTLDEPVEPAMGAPEASLVGSWPGARRVDCPAPPPEGQVCVPGGAYWMGNRRKLFTVLPEYDVNAPRLVVLSPFYLDAHEVTVADLRRDGEALADPGRPDADGTRTSDFCTFTIDPGPREAKPVNCIYWNEARDYCRRRGGDLPTEAQWEYVAGGLQNRSHPWGEDPAECEDAVYSRLGWGIFVNTFSSCAPKRPFGGPEPPGSGARDRLELPTGTIVDLAGNVLEWQRDVWNRSDEPCWSRPGVYVDPLCTTPSAAQPGLRSVRGGSWTLNAGQLDRTSRSAASSRVTLLDAGFRCASEAL